MLGIVCIGYVKGIVFQQACISVISAKRGSNYNMYWRKRQIHCWYFCGWQGSMPWTESTRLPLAGGWALLFCVWWCVPTLYASTFQRINPAYAASNNWRTNTWNNCSLIGATTCYVCPNGTFHNASGKYVDCNTYEALRPYCFFQIHPCVRCVGLENIQAAQAPPMFTLLSSVGCWKHVNRRYSMQWVSRRHSFGQLRYY